jgi:hypothetical protein
MIRISSVMQHYLAACTNGLAARETAKLSSSIWNRVISRLAMPRLLADPGQRTNVARYFKLDIATEQRSDLVWLRSLADSGKKLLCDARVLFSAHGLSPCA